MTELTKMASQAGCGCGGGGCGSSGSCAQCGQECAGGPLQRPLFFSGQLLTEEDLQLLSDYSATKMRLHNRYLHGSGVVCGLLVVCHPCGGGKVIVQPGAALDCCGNDIYVPCAVELDINKMVNELRLEKRGGYDCGDPCEAPCDDSPDDVRCIERVGRRYCLYISYCEELEEPVTPYLTGGDCALQVCKPTRLHEGFKFELRCPEEEPTPDNLFCRLLCCIGDLEGAERAADDALAANEYGRRRMAASAQVAAGQVGDFGESDRAELNKAAELESFAAPGGVNSPAQDAAAKAALPESKVRTLVDSYQSVASAVVRYDLQTDATKAQLAKATPALANEVENARRIVQQASQPLKAQTAAISSVRAQVVAGAVIEQGAALTAPGVNQTQLQSSQTLYYAYGAPSSSQIQKTFGSDAAQLREWLLDRIESKALASDCRLRHDLLSIELPTSDSDDDTLYEAQQKLTEILFRYLLDCICAALNPPCQPCLDPAVKLACLTVDDCEVVRICNLERTFVLSGPAIRYWVPLLHLIGELLEKACCELEVRVGRREQVGRIPASRQRQGYMAATAPSVSTPEAPAMLNSLFRLANVDARSATARINTIGSLGRLAGDSVTADFSLYTGDLRARMKTAVSVAAPDAKEAARAMVAPMESDVAELRSKVAEMRELSESRVAPLASNVEALSARVEAVQDVSAKVTPLVQDVAELRDRVVAARAAEEATRAATEKQVTRSIDDVRKEMAGLGKRVLDDSALVKELRKALDEQRKRSNALEARLNKLEPKKG